MRRFFRTVVVTAGICAPVTAFAAFVGPSQAPPMGNVPGVVWNIPASDPMKKQAAVEFNIAGSGRLGGDIFLENSKALRIDQIGDTSLNVGNWGAGKFTLNVIGDIKTDSSDGSTGRVSAYEYCYVDGMGASVNCIKDWPAGGGGGGGGGPFVKVPGDQMTGPLDVFLSGSTGTAVHGYNGDVGGLFEGLKTGVAGTATDPGSFGGVFVGAKGGARVSGGVNGVEATAGPGGKAFFGTGGSFGADVEGTTAGISAQGLNPGSIGGVFLGLAQGILTVGGTVGLDGRGNDAGLYGLDTSENSFGYVGFGSWGVYGNSAIPGGTGVVGFGHTNGVWGQAIGYPSYGIVGIRTDSFFGNGDMYLGGNIRNVNNVAAAGNITSGGNISATNNSLASCSWETVNTNTAYICSNGKVMAGVFKNASNIIQQIYCCEL